jgi:Ca2+-binding RTX toxin-like protein
MRGTWFRWDMARSWATRSTRGRRTRRTPLLAADDRWKLEPATRWPSRDSRTYNLALFSNFGEGLIRQSEFRTVEGAEARETHTFASWLQGMAGLDYHEDDIHNDDLDHYPLADRRSTAPFVKVLSSNITIRDLTPYAAVHGDLGKHVRFYAGVRPDTIELKNDNKMVSADSFDLVEYVSGPQGHAGVDAGNGPRAGCLRLRSAWGRRSLRRIRASPCRAQSDGPTGAAALPSPFERSPLHAVGAGKRVLATDVRVTVGRTTTTETWARSIPTTARPLTWDRAT